MNDKQKKQVFILGGVILAVIVLLIIIGIVQGRKKHTLSLAQQPYPAGRVIPTLEVKPTTVGNAALPQILDLTFSYDAEKKQLAITKKTQTNGVAHATTDTSLPYELWEVDANNTIIFDTHFTIATVMYLDSPYNRAGMQRLPHSSTIISVPYVPTAQTIIVTQNTKRILVFPIK